MDGSLRYPPTELAEASGLPSFLRMLRPPESAVLAVPEDFSPRDGLLTLWGDLAVVPPAVPWVFAGSSGFLMARGPLDAVVPPTA